MYKKRILTTYAPNKGYFRVRIGIGETAEYMGVGLPEDVMEAIETAEHYVEGRFVDIDISRREQLEAVKGLLKIKFK